MSQILDVAGQQKGTSIGVSIGASIRALREERGWSGAELAAASGVSRAMIDRIERGSSSPTAVLLGRLSAAFGMTLSTLLARAEQGPVGVSRAADVAEWTDPATGYRRRQLAAAPGFAVDVTEVTLPPGQTVPYPAGAFAFIRQLIWVLEGTLTFMQGDEALELAPGDSIILGDPVNREYINATQEDCRYAVIVAPAWSTDRAGQPS